MESESLNLLGIFIQRDLRTVLAVNLRVKLNLIAKSCGLKRKKVKLYNAVFKQVFIGYNFDLLFDFTLIYD